MVKLVATRGTEGTDHGTCWVMVSPAPELGRKQRQSGVSVILLDRGYDSKVAERAPWLLMGAKTLSYAVNMAALRHAKKNGADDVIFVSSDGIVLEGPTSTVLLAHRDGDTKRLITPTLETGILPGTTQGAIFAAARAAGWELGYGPLTPEHLMDAEGVWLVSSVRLLTPVNSIDGTRHRPRRAAACRADRHGRRHRIGANARWTPPAAGGQSEGSKVSKVQELFQLVPAAYVVFRRERQVLLQLRQNTGFMDGHWACAAAGHVEAGESVLAAAVREAAEETGVRLGPRTWCRWPPCTAPTAGTRRAPSAWTSSSTASRWSGEPGIMEPEKCAAIEWFDLDGLPDPMPEHERYVLENLAAGTLPAIASLGFGR